jgi:predicted nuclease with TOPRIM domain
MPAKKKVCFFLVILLLSGSMCIVDAVDASSNVTVTFRGAGVTIDLTYPEEAHPNTTIMHDVTITANANLTSINIGIFIYAPVNSTLQLIKNQPLSWGNLNENQSLPTSQISIRLPEQANGTLYCNMTVQTEMDPTTYYAYYSFYTTRVSELTFSEMKELYDEMLANYTALQEDYTALLDEYDGLLANYSSLFANYTALLGEYDALSAQYDAKVSSYQTLSAEYSKLLSDNAALNDNYKAKIAELGVLQANFDELNETRYSLQGNYTGLQADYDALNQTYTELQADFNGLQALVTQRENELNSDRVVMVIFVVAVAALVAFIVYIRWKKQEPYVVIRKETVSVNPDEKSEPPG